MADRSIANDFYLPLATAMQSATLINVISAHMAEFGIVAPTGVPRIKELLTVIADKEDLRSPSLARTVLEGLVRQYLSLNDCPRN